MKPFLTLFTFFYAFCSYGAVGFGFYQANYYRSSESDTSKKLEVTLSGTILNANTKKPISAEFDLYLDSDIIKEDVQIVHDGEYLEVITKPGWYLIEILAPGYLGASDTLWILNNKRKEIKRNYYLKPLEAGLNVVIPNINFHFEQITLTEDSYPLLRPFVEFLKKNHTVHFEIAGHTDDEGADDYNLHLSQGRAQSVLNYLVSQGADSTKLIAKGYGETMPIDTRNTKEGKAKNRRVEFTVLRHN